MSEAGQPDRQIDYASVQAAIEADVRLCEETRGHDWEQRAGYPHRSCRWCGAFEVVVDLERRTQQYTRDELSNVASSARSLMNNREARGDGTVPIAAWCPPVIEMHRLLVQAEDERDELRAALRDLQAWVIAPRAGLQYEALRARIDALLQ